MPENVHLLGGGRAGGSLIINYYCLHCIINNICI